MLPSRATALAFAMLWSAACGGAAQPAPTPVATPDPASPPATTVAASPTSAPTAAAGTLRFVVDGGSRAIVRVNEQLADRPLPNDAVLTTEKVTGEFSLQPDGTFTGDSRIVADLTTLTSDSRQRDDFIKRNTLQTSRFPEAAFAPTRTEGLALPLGSGELRFTLVGQMTIRGVTKEVAFDVVAQRDGQRITATATATPAFTFGQFGMEQPRVFSVLSIKDEIRLEVQLTATGT